MSFQEPGSRPGGSETPAGTLNSEPAGGFVEHQKPCGGSKIAHVPPTPNWYVGKNGSSGREGDAMWMFCGGGYAWGGSHARAPPAKPSIVSSGLPLGALARVTRRPVAAA